MRRHRGAAALILAVFMVIALAGCVPSGADQLYALPQLSDEYVQLEALIAQRIAAGGEYAAPTGGSNRQTVQLHDLDGDGRAEAIAFLADRSHTPNVCVYRQDDAGSFYLYTYIEGVGSAISGVEYADLTGDSAAELILTWQLSGSMKLLSVYALGGSEPQQLLSAACSGFLVCDLDGDGLSELAELSEDYYGQSVTRYAFPAGVCEETSARLSDGAGPVLRVRAGALSDGAAALFVDSRRQEDELITDVFAAQDGELKNITAAEDGVSPTLRPARAFSTDINGDRVTEIPGAEGDLLRWYAVDSDGDREAVLTTYHDFDDGWYLELGEELLGAHVEKRELVPGETAATFLDPDGNALLTIYTLTGENRQDRAAEEGRVVLARDGVTVYAASRPTKGGLDPAGIADSFHLIHQDWQSGII